MTSPFARLLDPRERDDDNDMADSAPRSSNYRGGGEAFDGDMSKHAHQSQVERQEFERDEAGFKEFELLPAGALDPVYEAKARILNQAVCRGCSAKAKGLY